MVRLPWPGEPQGYGSFSMHSLSPFPSLSPAASLKGPLFRTKLLYRFHDGLLRPESLPQMEKWAHIACVFVHLQGKHLELSLAPRKVQNHLLPVNRMFFLYSPGASRSLGFWRTSQASGEIKFHGTGCAHLSLEA